MCNYNTSLIVWQMPYKKLTMKEVNMKNAKGEIRLTELENLPKTEIVNVRLPTYLLDRIKKLAKKKNMTLSGYIRVTLEDKVFFYN